MSKEQVSRYVLPAGGRPPHQRHHPSTHARAPTPHSSWALLMRKNEAVVVVRAARAIRACRGSSPTRVGLHGLAVRNECRVIYFEGTVAWLKKKQSSVGRVSTSNLSGWVTTDLSSMGCGSRTANSCSLITLELYWRLIVTLTKYLWGCSCLIFLGVYGISHK